MTYFYAFLLALDPKKVKQQPTASRLKIITLGQLMLIPVALWFISGFMISTNLIQISSAKSILIGMICAGLIYVIDRSFITAFDHRHKWVMNGIRLGFAILSAVLGSLALDLVIFEGDIQTYQNNVVETKRVHYQQEHLDKFQTELAAMKDDVAQAREQFDTAVNNYTDEIDGKGTGRKGVGEAAKAKKAVADNAENNWKLAQEKLNTFRDTINAEAEKYARSQTRIEAGALLKKLQLFHEFVMSSKLNKVMYAVFFLLMLLIESMLIIYKIGARETFFEKFLRAEEAARQSELDSIRIRKQQLEAANRALGHSQVAQIRHIAEAGKN